MTSVLDSAFAIVLILGLNRWIVGLIRSSRPREEANFLVRVYWGTFAIRACGAVILNVLAADPTFAEALWGDSGTYDFSGYYLALHWSGETVVLHRGVTGVSGFGFHYFVAALYFVFGRNQLLVQLVNSTIGCVSVLLIHAIAKGIFDTRVARTAALLMAFLPQIVFWSCALYKDPAVLFCVALCMYSVLKLREEFYPRHVFGFILAALALLTLRFYVFYMVIFATLGTFVFTQRRQAFARIASQVVLVVAFFGALGLAVESETLEQQASYFDVELLQGARLGQATQGRSSFAGDVDVSRPGGFLAALPIGLAYLLFAPFPWAISGIRQLIVLPEMLVWYALFPALLRGLLHTIRYRLRPALPILVYATTLTLAYAVFQTNVGTAYRQRAQITMFFAILIGVGIEVKRRGPLSAIREPGSPSAS